MRAPFQILAIPYKLLNGEPLFCVFHRSDIDHWQFIAGGGEDSETPVQAAKREVYEESGVDAGNIIELTSMCYIPTDIFPNKQLYNWGNDIFVVPEYSFGFECNAVLKLSHEHTEYAWLNYEEARKKLKWDSSCTAMYELKCRLEAALH